MWPSTSFILRPGDIVSVRAKEKVQILYQGILTESVGEPTDWLTVDPETLSISVQGVPGPSDISLPVDGNVVVEFLSR